ncbi:MAG TPA: 8-amino-7-oxononanoate synthase [Gemmatimonadales bacterium]|nr:8-amino-7-oxononanoate synthase [Gemmatimonadales bacterium]
MTNHPIQLPGTAAPPPQGLREALGQELGTLERAGLRRTLRTVERCAGTQVLVDGQPAVDFSSNDYLGLAGDPRVRDAVCATVIQAGVGATASRSISGTHAAHSELERELAALKGAEAALLFTSGYTANAGVLPVLAGKRDVIYSDALNHASIIDGCRLSRATVRTFPHADLAALERLLIEDRGIYRRRVIVVEGVYSMDGDLFPVDQLVPLARAHGAWIFLDDAHGSGVLGPSGAGSAEHFGVAGQVDVTMGTLGKAFGVAGAYVAGPAVLRDLLLTRARSFLFTTAAPPALAAGALAAVRIGREEQWRRDQLQCNARRLAAGLAALGHQAAGPAAPGHIVPIIIGDSEHAVSIGRELLDRGFLVGAVRPPTVPLGSARLRVTVSAAHTDTQINGLLAALADLLPKRP